MQTMHSSVGFWSSRIGESDLLTLVNACVDTPVGWPVCCALLVSGRLGRKGGLDAREIGPRPTSDARRLHRPTHGHGSSTPHHGSPWAHRTDALRCVASRASRRVTDCVKTTHT